MTKKNILIICIALAACLILLGVGFLLNQSGPSAKVVTPAGDVLTAGETEAPVQSEAPAAAAAEPADAPAAASTDEPSAPTAAPTEAGKSIFETGKTDEEPLYLVASAGNITYEPVLLTGDGDYTLTQKDGDMKNVVHVTKNSITMASSTCDNQNCVQQGTVTRDNRTTRILGNMIICLPNQVTLQLCTADEIAQMLSVQ